MTLADFRALLHQLPPESQVPAGWVVEALEAAGVEQPADPAGPLLLDLTLAEASSIAGRAVSTLRGWCNRGELPGAYRLHDREWRIPRASLERYFEQQRTRPGGKQVVDDGRGLAMDDWKQEFEQKDDRNNPTAGEQ